MLLIKPVIVRLLEGFRKFPVDPYYEPLSWFMIDSDIQCILVALISYRPNYWYVAT